jgi:hypothetical protein
MSHGQMWYESPKGYTTTVDGTKMVVFWDTRSRGWKHVCDGEFSDFFHSLNDALDAAETALGVQGMVSRHRCRDVPPCDRGNAAGYRQHAREYGAATGAGTRFYRGAGRTPGPAAHPPATKVSAEHLFQTSFLSGTDARTAGVKDLIARNLARVKPSWASALGLKGMPPYTIEQVKTAYRELARLAHPDAGGDAGVMAKLNLAYEEGLKAAEAAKEEEMPF